MVQPAQWLIRPRERDAVCVWTFTGASVRFEMISTMTSTLVATDWVVTDRAAAAIVSTTLVHVWHRHHQHHHHHHHHHQQQQQQCDTDTDSLTLTSFVTQTRPGTEFSTWSCFSVSIHFKILCTRKCSNCDALQLEAARRCTSYSLLELRGSYKVWSWSTYPYILQCFHCWYVTLCCGCDLDLWPADRECL